MELSSFLTVSDKWLQVNEAMGVRTTNGYVKVYNTARSYISDPTLILSAVGYFKKKLMILHHQEQLDISKYFPILDAINQAARTNLAPDLPAPLETDWVNLLKVIIEGRGELHSLNQETSALLDGRCQIFAQAYIGLKAYGVSFVERDFNIYISEKSYELINSEIDQLCRRYGGANLMDALAGRISNTYNSRIGRFMEYRPSWMNTTRAAIPFGYLIAIASKHSGIVGKGDLDDFDKLCMLITYLIIVYEIQPNGCLDAMYLESDEVIEFIWNNMLYDGFVGIAQAKPSYASSLISFLQNEFSDKKYQSHGVQLKDVTRTALALISLAKTKKFTKVRVEAVAKKAGIAKFKVILAMDKLLSVPSGAVNAGLRFPPKSLEIDHYFKPAIKIGDEYLVFPKCIASLGCVNTVCNSIIRPNESWSNPLDSELGYAIERFIRKAFSSIGIKIAHGNVVNSEANLEADLICETSDMIYIFEIKKKGLTREAQSGDELKIYVDIANSILFSHSQAMKIESVLKKNDLLTLSQDGIEKNIYLDNRPIQRISVCFHDFGALQDKTILQRLLTMAVCNDVNHPDGSLDGKLGKWKEYSSILKELAIETGELGDPKRVPFHNSLLISVPLIILVIENSESAEVFFKHIRHLVNTTTGSQDGYTEFLRRLESAERCKI